MMLMMIKKETKFKIWIRDIISRVRENFIDESLKNIDAKTQRKLKLVENVYYVEDRKKELEKNLVDFLSVIPLWSNIMVDSFD